MAVDTQSEEARIIRQLIPVSTLPSHKFANLCGQLQIEIAEQGQFLFRRGDANCDLYYLLDGSVDLQTEAFKIETITAGSNSARFAIAHQCPRKVDAVAGSRVQFLRLNADMMKTSQETAYEENESIMMVEDLEDKDDWMTTLLKSPIFRGLPPANLQKILISLEEVSYKAGEVIINQGEQGDYYYIIKKGQVLISRKPTPNAKEIKLAQLGDLDTFGEDALISDEPRNVSVTALVESSLLRLNKEQFIKLIKIPSLKYIEFQDIQDCVRNGADLIDVRGPDEYKKSHLPNSINVPFFSLRMYFKSLNRQRPIIVVCKDGRTSETAAFILLRHKFNALILRGGIAKLRPDQLQAEPALFVIDDSNEPGSFSGSASQPESRIPSETGNVLSEATDLSQLVRELKAKCSALEADKMALELKCASITRQLEALKAELGRIKGGG